VDTTTTNVVGTVHVLEAMRRTSSVRAAVIVTTDKCYENDESGRPYRESDRLGGYDPYSASKAAAEIMTACYRQSFFNPERSGEPAAGVASARAGNVIGGGDWATDRLIPDAVTALAEGRDVLVRNPRSVRPWQHVLEPLSGYLWLGARLAEEPRRYASAWNFGPDPAGDLSVRDVADAAVAAWGSGRWVDGSAGQASAPHEARSLRLDCTRAHEELSWRPVWNVPEAVRATIDWYRGFYQTRPFDAASFTESQIDSYTRQAHDAALPWAAAVAHQDAGEAR
jgi:CDP-glucose 4,6-dehydratase